MGRIQRTIELARGSWNILKADKELLVLPVISAVASLIIAATFVLPFWGSLDTTEGSAPGGAFYVVMFVMYVVLAFVTIFFNAALVHAADERMRGGDPTVGSAIRGAASRVGLILPWAIVTATVSVILQAIEERAGIVGRIVAGLAGLAWSLVTFLVLPVLVIEGIGVGDAVRRSAQLFKQTWGENVAARVGFGLLGMVAVLPAVAIIALGAAAGGALLALLVVVAVAWIVLVSVVIAALSAIFQTALYRYAADGAVPGGYFDTGDLSGAFAPRGR
jgi:hypothetical protein